MLAAKLLYLYPTTQQFRDWDVVSFEGVETLIGWNAALGPLPSQATLDAVTQAQVDAAQTLRQRAQAKALYDLTTNHNPEAKILRALVVALLDEVNSLRGWLVSFKVEVAAATTLADLKTRVATLPNMPNRTAVQAHTAIYGKLDGGSVD